MAGNHALVDGDERLAWLATVVLPDINGRTVDLAPPKRDPLLPKQPG